MGTIGKVEVKRQGNHVKELLNTLIYWLIYLAKKKEVQLLKQASPMHDIGKVAIPDSILHKAGKLNGLELELMKTHAIKGYDLLKGSDRPLLKMAAIVAKEHHEKMGWKWLSYWIKRRRD